MNNQAYNFSVKNIKEILEKRQKLEYPNIIFVSGLSETGVGKSTLIWKIARRFSCFKPEKYMFYSRKDVMRVIEGEQYKFIFDDEAIRSGYKRDFYEKDQKKLITMFNMYRDNFNIYFGSIPNFYSLDKPLRNLCTMHISILHRGTAIVHQPNKRMYTDDPWDVAYNVKLENSWMSIKKNKPNYTPPYYKLTTFRGYLYWGDMQPREKEYYLRLKRQKRKEIYDNEMNVEGGKKGKEDYVSGLIKLLKGGHIDMEHIRLTAIAHGITLDAMRSRINTRLKNEAEGKTMSHYLKETRNSAGIERNSKENPHYGGLNEKTTNNLNDKKLPFEEGV